MDDIFASSSAVEVVYILGNDAQVVVFFQFHKCVVGSVGAYFLQLATALVVEI